MDTKLLVIVGVLLFASSLHAAVSCSANFCQQQTTLNTAGQQVNSGSFRENASLGQEAVTGTTTVRCTSGNETAPVDLRQMRTGSATALLDRFMVGAILLYFCAPVVTSDPS